MIKGIVTHVDLGVGVIVSTQGQKYKFELNKFPQAEWGQGVVFNEDERVCSTQEHWARDIESWDLSTEERDYSYDTHTNSKYGYNHLAQRPKKYTQILNRLKSILKIS